jgi:hypothetical protein
MRGLIIAIADQSHFSQNNKNIALISEFTVPIWMIKYFLTWNNKNINDFILMYCYS